MILSADLQRFESLGGKNLMQESYFGRVWKGRGKGVERAWNRLQTSNVGPGGTREAVLNLVLPRPRVIDGGSLKGLA